MFYNESDNDNLIIIIRVEEFYFNDVLSIRIDVFRNFCEIR